MTWIRTIPQSEADEKLLKALEAQRALYPIEYATPVQPTSDGSSGIVASHSLIPKALHHAFATFGALMSPDLPLTRRQHEMITTAVSVPIAVSCGILAAVRRDTLIDRIVSLGTLSLVATPEFLIATIAAIPWS